MKAAREAVAAEALSWFGTPYHHHGRIKGVGVDCAMLLAEVYERCGLVEHVDAGFYAVDWHLHRSEELFEAWMARAGGRQVQTPAIGDVGLWRFGRTWSHGSIVVAGDLQMIHSYIGRGVVLTRPTEDPLAGRAVQWWSVFPEGAE